MKIKKFIAPTINEAMLQVRRELGVEAVILANQTIEGQVHLTAALDEENDFEFREDESIAPLDTSAYFDDARVREALAYHGVLDLVRDRILASCRDISRREKLSDSYRVLEMALAGLFRFSTLLDRSSAYKMFMGTPGAGKSTAIAKTATQAKLQGLTTALVSTDNVRAGANKQLEAFAEILEAPFIFIREPRALFDFVQENRSRYQLILIDTPGINPFISREVEKVAAFADVLKCDKILTFDAGRNLYETIEVTEIFAEMGVNLLLPTRLDLTRRIGTVLSVAGCCELPFVAAGVNASIANGLAAIDSSSLTKLILA